MLPTSLDFTCPNCRDRFDTPLVNGVGEFQCFGCKKHYRLVVSADKEPFDFEKHEVSWEEEGHTLTEVESLPNEVRLTVKLTELAGVHEYYSR